MWTARWAGVKITPIFQRTTGADEPPSIITSHLRICVENS
jgi:hypothetical protein